MKNNLLSEKLVYTGDTRTPTHLHLVRYTPDEVHEYTASRRSNRNSPKRG